MRLSEFIEIEKNERAERRRLAEEKSYKILDRLEGVSDQFAEIAAATPSAVSRRRSLSVAPATPTSRQACSRRSATRATPPSLSPTARGTTRA